VPKSETWDLVRERLLSAVIPDTEEEAERRESNRLPKVVVYTPLVTVPEFPVIEAVIGLEKVLEPENVFESARRVEEAAPAREVRYPELLVHWLMLGEVNEETVRLSEDVATVEIALPVLESG
jgi:CRISPR/Cas system-associated protein Cas7 (RAMP superfamily)